MASSDMLRSQFLGQTLTTTTPVTEAAVSTSSVKITALFKRKAATIAKKVKKVASPADIELSKWYGESCQEGIIENGIPTSE